MASASTVAVVVPSPATSEVLEATSRTMRAPMFSYLSSSSISLATVTPSLVTVGEPKDFWMMTLRPLGPRVTLTARASLATPRRIASRASWSNAICLALMVNVSSVPCPLAQMIRVVSVENGENVFLVHDEDFAGGLAVLELVAGPGGEQNFVT